MTQIILIFAAVFFGAFSIAFFAYALLNALSSSTAKKSESILSKYEKN